MARTFHYLRAPGLVADLKIALPNFAAGGGSEVLTGGVLTAEVSVEYPVGEARAQCTFGGSTIGTAGADQPLLWSDCALATPIPDGALFFVYVSESNSVRLPYNGPGLGGYPYAGGGDAIEQTNVDKTSNGTVADQKIGIGLWPVAIWGLTSARTIGVLGDSRQVGVTDLDGDATGNLGEVQRALGQQYAIQNVAASGEQAAQFLDASAIRRSLLAPTTTIIDALGINDVGRNGGYGSEWIKAKKAAVRDLFPQDDYWSVTLPPESDGDFNVVGGQKPTAGNSVRLELNTWIRALGGGIYSGFLDPCAVVEEGDTGTWKVPGFTFDGVHETSAANTRYSFSLN